MLNSRKTVRWSNSAFLLTTLFSTLTAVPAYIWHAGLNAFHVGLFFLFFIATGLSITLGYHRLYSHRSFQARWPVRFFTLAFGAAAFENSAICWASDHRRHHKFTDHEEDPYDISKGFFHAHIGWILFREKPDDDLSNVKDLFQDRMASFQHRHYNLIAILVGFVLPALLGALWEGWIGALGGFLIAGVARVVFVHHMTFFINSLCHTIGDQPYSSACSARDSAIMAPLTFGEGYHNFHHAFQHDYRNGVKPWQFDPTKWTIWLLHKMGLADNLRRVPPERILLAEITEKQRRLAAELSTRPAPLQEAIHAKLQVAHERLHQAFRNWELLQVEYSRAVEKKLEASREKMAQIRNDFYEARERFRLAIHEWHAAHQFALAQFGQTA